MYFSKFLLITSLLYSTSLISSDGIPYFNQISEGYHYGAGDQVETEDFDQFVEEIDYCDLNCNDGIHTACVPDGGKCPTTCARQKYTALTHAQKRAILGLHNLMRNKVAGGQESAAKLGGIQVANMQLLRWDHNAEYVAECHVKKCIKGHDSCRRLNKRLHCGQNIAYIRLTNESNHAIRAKDFFNRAVYSWYDQVKHCDSNFKTPFSGELAGNTFAFTQFIWATTSTIGCAYMKNTGQSENKIMLTCNYCPAGNLPNHYVFRMGRVLHPCDINPLYPNLCDLTRIPNARRLNLDRFLEKSRHESEDDKKRNAAVGMLDVQIIGVVVLIGGSMLLRHL